MAQRLVAFDLRQPYVGFPQEPVVLVDQPFDRFLGQRLRLRSALVRDACELVPQTRWLDLREKVWVRADNDSSGRGYKFTGPGLLAAMKLSGQLEDRVHKEQCVRLKTAFKYLVKGRELPGATTDTWELVAQTGLTDRWIWNALDARILAHEWQNDYVDVEVRSGGRDIRVSATFGMRRPWGMESGPLTLIPEGD